MDRFTIAWCLAPILYGLSGYFIVKCLMFCSVSCKKTHPVQLSREDLLAIKVLYSQPLLVHSSEQQQKACSATNEDVEAARTLSPLTSKINNGEKQRLLLKVFTIQEEQ